MRLLSIPALVAALAAGVPGVARPDDGPGSLLGPSEVGAVLDALGRMNLQPTDLDWDRDYVNGPAGVWDPWRLDLPDRLLADPLHVPEASQPLALAALRAGADPMEQIRAAAAALGLAPPAADLRPPRSDVPLPSDLDLPPGPLPPGKAGRSLLKGWRKLPPAFRESVGDAVRSLHALRRDTRSALGPVAANNDSWNRFRELALRTIDPRSDDEDSEEQQRERILALARSGASADRAALARAGAGLVAVARQLEQAARSVAPGSWPTVPLAIDTPAGRVVIGTPRPDAFSGEAALVIDPGGDDSYALAGARQAGEVQLLLDLAGDDTYRSAFPGAVAGALGGVSLLVDVAGNDVYDGSRVSLGAAILGVALLVDRTGSDLYRGETFTQGAGLFGVGVLADGNSASDTYTAGVHGQGLGLTLGYGAVVDGGGDDQYRLGGTHPDSPSRFPDHTLSLGQGFGFGFRPYAGGGIGLLADGQGNDVYAAELFAQGCAYWFGLGVLYDAAGNDSYRAWQYGQGSGIHLAVGLLADLAGNDQYMIENLGQGSSHDLAVGWLVDKGGDDLYSGATSVQGGSLTNSASFFLDAGGNDAYSARSLKTSRGGGDLRRHMGTLGVFVDLGGNDVYNQRDDAGLVRNGGDNTAVRPWAYGIALDLDALPEGSRTLSFPSPPARTRGPARPIQEPGPLPAAAGEVAEANAWLVGNQRAADRIADLAARGPAYTPDLLALMRRENLLEQYTVEAILRAIRDRSDESGREELWGLLRAHLQEAEDYDGLRWSLRWLAELGLHPADTVAALTARSGSERWRVRGGVAEALGVLAVPDGAPTLVLLLADPHEAVRTQAAWALGRTGGSGALLALGQALRDRSFLVRFASAASLIERAASGESQSSAAHVRALRKEATDPQQTGFADDLLQAIEKPYDPGVRAFWGLDATTWPPPAAAAVIQKTDAGKAATVTKARKPSKSAAARRKAKKKKRRK